MSAIVNVSRRRFLAGGVVATGALVLGVHYYPKLSFGDKLPQDTKRRSRHITSQRVSRYRSRRHGVDRRQSLGDGHDEPHDVTSGRRG